MFFGFFCLGSVSTYPHGLVPAFMYLIVFLVGSYAHFSPENWLFHVPSADPRPSIDVLLLRFRLVGNWFLPFWGGTCIVRLQSWVMCLFSVLSSYY